jgi:hypothetical protein
MTIFSQTQLQQAVAAIPPDLPEGHSSAIVGTVDQTGAQVIVGFKKDALGGTWQAQGAFRHDWSGDNSVGARFIYSF